MNCRKTAGIASLAVFAATLSVPSLTTSAAAGDIITASCGAPIKSRTKSFSNGTITTNSAAYINIKGANVGVTVPSGQTQCVRVRFSTSAACAVSNSTDHCFVKPIDSTGQANSPFSPVAAVYTSDPSLGAHSFEWVARFEAGSYVIQMQAATSNSSTTFTLGNWVIVVETTQ